MNYGEIVTVNRANKLVVVIGNHHEINEFIFVAYTDIDSTDENKIKVSNMTMEEIYNFPVKGYYSYKLNKINNPIWNIALQNVESEVQEYKDVIENMTNVEIMQELVDYKNNPSSMKKYILIQTCEYRGFDYAQKILSFIME